jgi:hypothetical protein
MATSTPIQRDPEGQTAFGVLAGKIPATPYALSRIGCATPDGPRRINDPPRKKQISTRF